MIRKLAALGVCVCQLCPCTAIVGVYNELGLWGIPVCPSGVKKGVFITDAIDNVVHNPSSATA